MKNTITLNNLLKCVGWKNINRIRYVTYLNQNNDLLSIIEEPVTPKSCNTKLRATTVFLGCTYASILLDIVIAVNYQVIFYENIISNNESCKLQVHNCTVKLLEIFSNITLFTKKMQGALYAIDSMHEKPWKLNKRYQFILKLVFDKFLSLQRQLNNYSSTKKNVSVYSNDILKNIKENLKEIKININVDINQYCRLEPNNIYLLANKLKAKYKNFNFERENVALYNNGCEIKMLILENYTNLGLKFILNTLDHDLKEAENEYAISPAPIPVFYDSHHKEAEKKSEISPASPPVFYDFFQKEAENKSEISPASISNFCNSHYTEAENKSEISPAPIPVFLDSFNKEVENKSEIFPASISNFCNSHHTEAENKSEISPAPIPVFLDSFNKEVDNDSEISPATIPVFYDFLQKDLIGDVTMNDEFEIETEDLTKKETRNFISSFK
ncbi:uncharacterized protein LOC126899413 isoform X2 [Daktulosphaira vitifoliae]|uniref:uncharacterized protein LOC126899413 isoform X2 n=2 Tax=Daktulosphaira vitifoliae TaxID=58002 RepID=UPI0021AA8956|nr:uncharacterized protein LOC126899413 isoform X2 [Daktulosphaira vitifoliae]